MASAHQGNGTARKRPPRTKLSRLRKPDDMSIEAWQVALRREFGRQQDFKLKNVGEEPIFSDFEVTNPQTKRTYRVAIRGVSPGDNFCSCPDFAVNTLGTCKHVEFTLSRLEKKSGAKRAMAAGYQPPYSEVCLHYGAQREARFRAGSQCPQRLRTLARRYFDSDGRLRPGAFSQFHAFLKQAAAFEHELRCYDDAMGWIAQLRDRAELARRVDREFPRGIRSPAFKKLLSVPLYPYQREGALFVAKAGRSLLADDMGLGKTIQAIAAAEILARTAGIERVLVVSPTSLKHQWQQEIEKFSGRPAMVIEGLSFRRAELYAAPSFYKLINYDVVFRDVDLIRRWQPDLIILDEAQRIKNWQTRTAQSVKQLQSPYALVLTGTPLENRLEELHSIVEFVDRFRLGPMFRFLAEHQHADEHGRVIGYRNLGRISRTLAPILLRRTKDKVLRDLPERLEKRFFVPMTSQQAAYHEENRETVARLVSKWRRNGFLSEGDQLRMRIALQNMRMSCDSTYLLDQKTDFGRKADEMVNLLEEIFEEPEAKVVVFSQWVRMHELVIQRLRHRKWDHVLFYGGVPGPKRKDLVRRFKEDPDCRLFLATDAGGVGLNLQNASAVVNLDQPWNPAVLEQRIGRVHRLGQHRPVRVVHFIAQGTIEEGMLGILAFKKSMFAGVLDKGDDEVFLGGTKLTRFMESVEKVTGAMPKTMPTEAQPPVAGEAGADGAEAGDDGAAEPGGTAETVSPEQQLWHDVAAAGQSLLEKLTQALTPGKAGGPSAGAAAPGSLVVRDEPTGQPYLRVPLPEPETLQKIVELFRGLVGGK